MAFAGIAPGMKIADVFGGGGYWTELMARAVGPEGHVRLVNNTPYLQFAGEEVKPRFEGDRLPNTELRVVETCDLKLGRKTFDMISSSIPPCAARRTASRTCTASAKAGAARSGDFQLLRRLSRNFAGSSPRSSTSTSAEPTITPSA